MLAPRANPAPNGLANAASVNSGGSQVIFGAANGILINTGASAITTDTGNSGYSSPHVEDKIEVRREAARDFRHSHHQLAAE
jgi:hypothetical protein